MSVFFQTDPVVFQGESNECGLACLAAVLAHHSHHVSLAELRQRHPDGSALSLDQLAGLCHQFELQTRCLRCEPNDLTQLALPAIVHVDFDHYVVLTRITARGVVVMDPGRGSTQWSHNTLSRRFTGIVLELNPSAAFQKSGEGIRYSPFRLLSGLPLTNLAASMWCLLGLSVVVQVFALATPFFIQVIVDEVLLLDNPDMALIVTAGFAAIYVLSSMTQWLRGLLAIRLGTRLSFMLSASLLKHATSLPLSFFKRRSIGDIVSRFGSLKPIQTFISDSVVMIVLDLLMIVSTLVMIFCFSSVIAAFVLLATCLFMLLQWILLQPYRQHNHEFLIADASVQTHFIETLQSISTVKRFEATASRDNEWQNRLTLSLNAQIRASRWSLGSEISRFLFSGLLVLGVAYLAVGDIKASLMTLGMLYTLIAYANHFASAILSLSDQWQSYMMLALHAQRVSDISEHPRDARVAMPMSRPVTRISLKSLAVQFPNHPAPLFEHLCLQVKPNESVAICGLSGSGKSSLLSILTGEQQPDQGEVMLNEQPLSGSLNPGQVFSTLLPGDMLIEGTVIDNIVYGNHQIDQERLLQVTALAEIYTDILRLPLSWQEKLSEQGSTLSAGQRQRLLIARALYRTADVLILDEGTSHLDQQTEHRIMRAILALPGICFFVTHRSDIAALADHQIALGPANDLHMQKTCHD